MSHHRDRRRQVLPDLCRVDVDVDDRRVGVEVVEPPHRAVVEPHPDPDHDVCLVRRHVRVVHAVHAEEAVAQRVRLGESSDPEERRDHRDLRFLRQLHQLVRGVAPDDPVPRDDDRALGLVDGVRRPPDHPRVPLGRRAVAAQVDLLRPLELRFLLEHVLGNVDVDRAGAARARDVERLADRHRDVLGPHHEVVVLRDRLRDAGDVGFLEAVLAQQRARHVPRDRHHRRRVQE